MTALAKWGALHEVLDPPSSSLPGLTGSRGNVADEEKLCSIMSARCWMPSSMPMAKNFATTIECFLMIVLLIAYCDKRGGHSRSARKARGRQRSHQHSALPQPLTGSQRKLFSEFSRRSCETGAVLLFPPLFLPSYANRAWWRLVVPLTGLEYERHSMPSMILFPPMPRPAHVPARLGAGKNN